MRCFGMLPANRVIIRSPTYGRVRATQASCRQASAAAQCGTGCPSRWVTRTTMRSTRCRCTAPSLRVRLSATSRGLCSKRQRTAAHAASYLAQHPPKHPATGQRQSRFVRAMATLLRQWRCIQKQLYSALPACSSEHRCACAGFCSIEADVYVINGTLVIGHDVEELNTSVTLQVRAPGGQHPRRFK